MSKNFTTTIYWRNLNDNPPPSGKPILFLRGQNKVRAFCIGRIEYDTQGERVWLDESTTDNNGDPTEFRDGEVSHWALYPEIRIP